MCIRNAGITLAVLVVLGALGVTYHSLSAAPLRKNPPVQPSLSEEYLRGGMQGKSGIALDINGDGNDDLIVGAPYAQRNGSLGALVIYEGTPTGLVTRATEVLRGEGNFGWSLTALGDMAYAGKGYFAASAVNGSGPKASLAGTVTIFKGERLQTVAVLEGENAMDRFGFTLASGDLNGDGNPDLVIGAPMHSPSPSLYQLGAVYVFFGPVFDPQEAVKISSSATLTGIGFSLTTGDINNDGKDDLLIGASGKVAVYYGGASFPSSTPDALFTSRDAGFGRALAVIWDVDGDGFRDVAIGAFQAVIGNVTDVGRLFVIRGGFGTRTVNADVASPDKLCAIAGEMNSGQFAATLLPVKDSGGNNILAVGATHADGSLWPMTGKIFLFSGSDIAHGTPVVSVKSLPGEARDMHLGTFLAQVRGAWGTLLSAGGPTEDVNTGRVRLFELTTFSR